MNNRKIPIGSVRPAIALSFILIMDVTKKIFA